MDVALVTNCQHSKQLVCHLQVLQTTLENNFRHFGAPTPKLTVSLSLSKGQLRCSMGTMEYIPYWMLGWVLEAGMGGHYITARGERGGLGGWRV